MSFWRRARQRLLTRTLRPFIRLELAPDSRTHPRNPNDASNHTIRNFPAPCVIRKAQTQPTIDDTQCDYDAAEPDVNCPPE